MIHRCPAPAPDQRRLMGGKDQSRGLAQELANKSQQQQMVSLKLLESMTKVSQSQYKRQSQWGRGGRGQFGGRPQMGGDGGFKSGRVSPTQSWGGGSRPQWGQGGRPPTSSSGWGASQSQGWGHPRLSGGDAPVRGGGCFGCGGPHMLKDCDKRWHPSSPPTSVGLFSLPKGSHGGYWRERKEREKESERWMMGQQMQRPSPPTISTPPPLPPPPEPEDDWGLE